MLVTEDQLKEWTGFEHRARLIDWLNRHNIPWWPGKDKRVCTTYDRLDCALNGTETEEAEI